MYQWHKTGFNVTPKRKIHKVRRTPVKRHKQASLSRTIVTLEFVPRREDASKWLLHARVVRHLAQKRERRETTVPSNVAILVLFAIEVDVDDDDDDREKEFSPCS